MGGGEVEGVIVWVVGVEKEGVLGESEGGGGRKGDRVFDDEVDEGVVYEVGKDGERGKVGVVREWRRWGEMENWGMKGE